MSRFLTELDVRLKDDDTLWIILSPLIYESDMLGRIEVPVGFLTDFASVPRIPIVYRLYGDRAHRESTLHDYLYRVDSLPSVTYSQANKAFLEAMKSRGKSPLICYGMYWGVVLGGWPHYHKKAVMDKL